MFYNQGLLPDGPPPPGGVTWREARCYLPLVERESQQGKAHDKLAGLVYGFMGEYNTQLEPCKVRLACVCVCVCVRVCRL